MPRVAGNIERAGECAVFRWKFSSTGPRRRYVWLTAMTVSEKV